MSLVAKSGIANDWSGCIAQLREQGFAPTEDGWVAQQQNPRTPATKTLLAIDLTISEPVVSEGGDILIIAEKLSFAGNGLISSGYRGDAPDGVVGSKAGSITIIAKDIQSLRVSAKGQTGGQGRRGADSTGIGESGRHGAPGENAKCRDTSGTDGKDGEDGARGPSGGPGGPGAPGGVSGNVNIQYWTSRVSLAAPPKGVVDVSGGEGGRGGQGGQGGRGGPGGRGGAGGKGAWCRPLGDHGDGIELPGGEPGRDGDTGPSGPWGPNGAQGAAGAQGRREIRQFPSEADFYDEAARHAPALFSGLLGKAEMMYLLNRDEEARTLLEKVRLLKGDDGKPRPDAMRAETLLLQMQNSLTYFGEPKDAAAVMFKDGQDARNVPLSLEDVHVKFAQKTNEVQTSESLLAYRRRQEWDGKRAEEAYRLESDKLASSIRDFVNDIEGFAGEIEVLRSRLVAFDRQARELVDRIRRLYSELAGLPGNVQSAFGELFGAVDGAIGHLGTIGAALAAPTISWPVVALGFANFLGSIGQAESAARRLLELGNHLKAQIEKAKDDLFYIRNEMANAEATIAKLTLRKISAQQRIGEYRRILQNLDSWWNSRDVAQLAELTKIAELAHREIRMSVARDIYKLLRYVDLRTGRREGQAPQTPPDGLNDAFNAVHMQAILRRISSLLVNEPPTASIDEELASFDRDQHRELFAAIDNNLPMNVVVNAIPREYERARVRSIAVIARDNSGAPVSGGSVFIANHRVQYFPSAKTRYLVPQYNVPLPLGRWDDNAKIFALQSPLTTWTVQFSRARPQTFSLVFRIELPVTEIVPPASDRSPVRAPEELGSSLDSRPPWDDIQRLETMSASAKT